MTILQVFNYILPLVIVPFLFRILGPEKYGLIAFSQAFIQYFVIVTDYGFNLSATRDVSINRKDPVKVSEIFSSVMAVKLISTMGCLGILILLVQFVPFLQKDAELYLITFTLVLGNALFPNWFFQGIEKMHYITAINIVSKCLMVASIFILIQTQDDFILAVLIQTGSFLLSGAAALLIALRRFKLKLIKPTREQVRMALRNGWNVFISTAAISLYTNSNPFILGVLTDLTSVGYFSAAEKLVKAVVGLFAPIAQALYPRICILAVESPPQAIFFIKKAIKNIGALSLFFSLVLLVEAPLIVDMVFGLEFKAAVSLVRCMAFLPLVVSLSNILGVQTMLTFGLQSEFSRILIFAGVSNIVVIIPLVLAMGAKGAALSVFFTETIVASTMYAVLWKQGFFSKKRWDG